MTDVKFATAAVLLLTMGSLFVENPTLGNSALGSPTLSATGNSTGQIEMAAEAVPEFATTASSPTNTLAIGKVQQDAESEKTDLEPSTEVESEISVTYEDLPAENSAEDTPDQDNTTSKSNGFLPTRGSIMLDFVFLAMLLILPVMQFSIYQAQRKRYRLHRTIQIGTAIALLLAVVLFELDMRLYTDWRKLAEPSVLYDWCTELLYFHLCFAVPTPFIWGWVIYGALRNLDANFQGSYVVQHRLAGKIAAIMMYGTGLTGILFYVVAFVL